MAVTRNAAIRIAHTHTAASAITVVNGKIISDGSVAKTRHVSLTIATARAILVRHSTSRTKVSAVSTTITQNATVNTVEFSSETASMSFTVGSAKTASVPLIAICELAPWNELELPAATVAFCPMSNRSCAE